MPAGEFFVGEGAFGLDPVEAPSAAYVIQKTPAAIAFDPVTRRFTMLDNGRFAEVHPIDQMIALALGVAAGSWKSAPNAGHTLSSLPGASDPSFEASAQDRVRIALRVPLSRGDIVIDAITVNPITVGPLRGRTEVVVTYFNLRSAQPTKLRSSSGNL